MTEHECLLKYVSVVPNERQLAVQDMHFYAFVHYTVNTFTGKEWGSGKESPSVFAPKRQNTDQWCEAIAAAGMRGLILTCKHHDGFCLWDTKTTSHNVMNSPHGKDVVKEVSDSCKKYGLKFGVYLSPWDRNSEYYGTDRYNDFYIEQLTELLTGYGEIFMLWLDGACGDEKNGKAPQEYDFPRIWSTALALQPHICISGCAPDVRWVGNERGVCRESEWSVVPKFLYDKQNIEEDGAEAVNAAQTDGNLQAFQKRSEGAMKKDLGSREFLSHYRDLIWYPAEVDVSIRAGWFHHGFFDRTTKSLNRLMEIYYGSVGGNGLLLLNVPPTKDGLIAKADVKRLTQIGEWIKREDSLVLKDVCSEPFRKTERGFEAVFRFQKTEIDRIRLQEDTHFSQRVERFSLFAVDGEKETLLYRGTVIGFGKTAVFEPTKTSAVRVVVSECRFEPHFRFVQVVASGAYRVKQR